ncbi:hypothetical protein ASZ90_009793 [hydrocarbon metagenome]|uniref:Uncharacterized protein n=1 Tax=hydrocarbon metagenome TaxID=938273 RepID=A0A0W8FHX2_9ZZZZ
MPHSDASGPLGCASPNRAKILEGHTLLFLPQEMPESRGISALHGMDVCLPCK